MHIKVTVTNNLQKLEILLTYRGKLPRKKFDIFCFKDRHFPHKTTFPDKIFYQKNTFLQIEVKVKLQIHFQRDISIDGRINISVDVIE